MGIEVDVNYVAGVRFDASARGHHVSCDQPLENKGTDQGMTPPELLLASLGSCALYYAVEYLRARGLDERQTSVTVRAEKDLKPTRLARFVIVLRTPLALEARHREGLKRAVHNCLVHNTLLHAPEIAINLEQSLQPEFAPAS